MGYRIVGDHAEALRDGRMVGPGDRISDADAKKNPRLIEREILVKEADRQKPQAKESRDPAPEPAAEQENKEDQK